MSLPREGSLAGQELGPCQEVGWYRETARDVLKRLEGCEHQRRAPEQGPHRIPQCDGERHECTFEKKACQFNILGMKREQKISSYAPMEII